MKIQVIMAMHKNHPHLMYLHETNEGNWYCLEYDRNIYFTQSILHKGISTQHIINEKTFKARSPITEGRHLAYTLKRLTCMIT